MDNKTKYQRLRQSIGLHESIYYQLRDKKKDFEAEKLKPAIEKMWIYLAELKTKF